MVEWIQRYRGVLFVLLVVVILAAIVLMQVLRPGSAPPIMASLSPAASPQPTDEQRPLRVYVSGAVQQPDVYVLPRDSIVKDAIEAAGGATGEADLDRINLAQALADGQHIYVPHLGEASTPAPLRSQPEAPLLSSPGATAQVNINTAGLSELDRLPGIGPAIAQRILDYRQAHGPFAKIEDIMQVSGIGPVTFEKIRELITTE